MLKLYGTLSTAYSSMEFIFSVNLLQWWIVFYFSYVFSKLGRLSVKIFTITVFRMTYFFNECGIHVTKKLNNPLVGLGDTRFLMKWKSPQNTLDNDNIVHELFKMLQHHRNLKRPMRMERIILIDRSIIIFNANVIWLQKILFSNKIVYLTLFFIYPALGRSIFQVINFGEKFD